MWNLIQNLPKNTFCNESGSEITLANYKVKYIAKVIRSIENRRIFLKRTTRKIINQKGGLHNFLKPLIVGYN